jgi:hypothetical protein
MYATAYFDSTPDFKFGEIIRHGDGEIRHLELIDRQPLQVFSMLYNKYNTYLEIT